MRIKLKPFVSSSPFLAGQLLLLFLQLFLCSLPFLRISYQHHIEHSLLLLLRLLFRCFNLNEFPLTYSSPSLPQPYLHVIHTTPRLFTCRLLRSWLAGIRFPFLFKQSSIAMSLPSPLPSGFSSCKAFALTARHLRLIQLLFCYLESKHDAQGGILTLHKVSLLSFASFVGSLLPSLSLSLCVSLVRSRSIG